MCQVQFEPISSLLAASYSLDAFFLSEIRNFFWELAVRKKWTENRELHELRVRNDDWGRQKLFFETIVKNCFYVIHYEKLEIIYQVHVEISFYCLLLCRGLFWDAQYESMKIKVSWYFWGSMCCQKRINEFLLVEKLMI